jgi:flavin reductase (DIM6/NTAB) family NADH-FMN oxidoreductase RutF
MKTLTFDGRSPMQKQGMLSQLVIPRPIAMVTTIDPDGRLNVAPFSYFMPVCGEPPLIALTIGTRREAEPERKDTWRNIQDCDGEFVINVTTDALAEHIETAAREYPYGTSELEITGWQTMPSQMVRPPSLQESPAHMECVVREVLTRGDVTMVASGVHLVLAEVLCITADESILTDDDHVDPTKVRAVGRMGFPWFVQTGPESNFTQERVAYADL